MKQTKHSRKSESQNLCSKCPPFTRTHAFKRLRHCAIADGFGSSVQSWCYAAALLGTRVKVNGDYYWNTVLLNMLLLVIRSVFGDYYVFQQDCQDGAPAHRSRDTCHHAAERETPEFIPPEMWPPNLPDFNPVDYSIWDMLQEMVYRSRIYNVKELKERLLREWRLLHHAHHQAGSGCKPGESW